ncbi:MAG TPA: acyltransferase [Bacteroidia bacterium]|nr:acyltransferase [Bacteroidia bacterium]
MLYFSKLDSLRFIAFFLVFWSHNFVPCFNKWANEPWRKFLNPFFETGINGVHIFFVISGFLITHLLIREHQISGEINVKKFYLRRILRIWPLYYLIMILGLFILPNLSNIFEFCGSYWMNLSFLNNFNAAESANCFSTHVVIAWSVAIEEQFYLFWPIAFYLFYKRGYLIGFCIIVMVMSMISTKYFSYFSTIANLVYLMTGCLGALLFEKYRNWFEHGIFKEKKWFYLFILILCSTMLIAEHSAYGKFIKVLFLPLLYLYFVLYTIINNTSKQTFLSYLGKYTYGMYFYHPLISIFIRILFDKIGIPYLDNGVNFGIASVIALIVTTVVSIISYNYFEGYFLKLKSKLSVVNTRV